MPALLCYLQSLQYWSRMVVCLDSDKLAKWCCLGVQGGLLSALLEEPIYIRSLTVALSSELSQRAMQAADAALHRAVAGEEAEPRAISLPSGLQARIVGH